MIGRAEEIKIMQDLLSAKESDLLAVIGRRRVGKTYMIEQVYRDHLIFNFTGTQDALMSNQLEKFTEKLAHYSKNKTQLKIPISWAEAFKQLKSYVESLRKSAKKKVIFFDEVPWIASRGSGFLEEFTYWWNDWAVKQNLLVVICGSAATWMIDKVIRSKGGLHNRVTKQINVLPFTLSETQAFLQSKNIKTDHYQTIQLYMVLGGIPHYLKEVQSGESIAQAIQRICFKSSGTLHHEFHNLYAALFDKYKNHQAVIKALASKHYGMTRSEIGKVTKLGVGGGLTRILEELEASSFIISISPYGKKKKNTLFRLVDEYSLFYIKYIEGQVAGHRNTWLRLSSDPSYNIWQGYGFENICIKHAEAIKKAIGISGIQSSVHSYFERPSNELKGLQIDMLIDRADRAINLCEMKFYDDEVTINESMADNLRKRRSLFKERSGTKKMVFNTLVTTYGVHKNQFSLAQVDQVVTMNALFDLDRF